MYTTARASVAKVCALATLWVAFVASAQQPGTAHTQQLPPLVVDDGKHQGEIDLLIDLGLRGVVATVATSSPGELATIAAQYVKMLRYPADAGGSGFQQRVLFLQAGDVKTVAPVYPALARMHHLQGIVRLIATVGPDGRVTSAAVVFGDPLLINSAQASLMQWIFPPVDQGGAPVAYQAVVDIHFSMN